MSTVASLLDEKGRGIFSIDADASVFDAVAMMAEKNIGALAVSSADSPLAGILSERDYTRKIILLGRASKSTKVGEIMTPDVIYAREDTPIEKCMALMTEKKIRHLPIVSESNEPRAMITLGDIMKTIIHEQELTIEELESFMFVEEGGEG